jgi:hypothetical protein
MRKLHFGLKGFFKRTDLVREGEMWTGGLASLSILVFIGFAAYFSASFVQQYPIENVGDSYFACDLTIRNAKFGTEIQSLGTPPNEEEQPIFDMMNSQSFTLNIDFVQTAFNCTAVSVYNTRLTVPTSVPFSCPTQSISNILSISVNITSVNNNFKIILNSILPIGALRIGMVAPEERKNEYLVRQLEFLQPFYTNNRILASESTLSLELTKIINITEPLDNSGTTQYSALFIPSFLVNLDQTFISQTDYNVMPSFTQTSISIAMSETSYYINNNQEPIAKQSEVIFRNILFAIVCIEIFGFAFLVCKLFFLPMIEYCLRKIQRGQKHGTTNQTDERQSSDRRATALTSLSTLAVAPLSLSSDRTRRWQKHETTKQTDERRSTDRQATSPTSLSTLAVAPFSLSSDRTRRWQKHGTTNQTDERRSTDRQATSPTSLSTSAVAPLSLSSDRTVGGHQRLVSIRTRTGTLNVRISNDNA